MQRCIDLARNGKGLVAPNPMVGSVIVYNNKIIGEGYHQKFGHSHAEVNAIKSVKNKDLLCESALYVNLEPCAHSGKTPPCSDLIIDKRITKVVIGTVDPNSLVAGKGIEKLRASGIEVVEGILENECYELNKRFFTFHKYKRPYIIIKWAQSIDGYIDFNRNSETPIGPNWISNPLSRMLVHKWRSVEQGIMVGTDTVIFDNPGLDTRFWPGNSPLRIIVDRNNRISPSSKVLDGKAPTIVFTKGKPEEAQTLNTEFICTDFENILENIFEELYKRDIQSIIIEGGGKLLQSFIDLNLWDEARIFEGRVEFKGGIKAPGISNPGKFIQNILGDRLVIYYNVK